ncbi:MAG: alanyl-tRNA editing protein [Oscillospiraceae bacterium]|nr:alanyl-tRNA editing protein [Oscillospiraceae bacterium]
MTEKLYYIDSHLFAFEAVVTSCEETKRGFAVELDRTAFFPEGGGQLADTGSIGPARVLDVHEKEGRILHYTDRPLPVEERFACAVDAEQRRRRMQNHSGEHIVSGLVYREHGFDNVGFHMGADCMTMDYSGELSWEQLMRIERLANEAVRADLPLKIWFPPEEELASLFYRSKLDLTENVRIVEIPGIDRCACCAPHVERTGEVGLVKILTAERHRGGVRITAVCGMDAVELAARQQESVTAISGLLSVPREQIVSGVERLLETQTAQKERIAALSLELARLRAESAEKTEGNLVLFDRVLDEVAQRELVNLLMEKCAVAAVFSGSDAEGWRYVIGSRETDLRKNGRAVNAGIQGRGGGSPRMIQGRAAADSETIRAFFRDWRGEA